MRRSLLMPVMLMVCSAAQATAPDRYNLKFLAENAVLVDGTLYLPTAAELDMGALATFPAFTVPGGTKQPVVYAKAGVFEGRYYTLEHYTRAGYTMTYAAGVLTWSRGQDRVSTPLTLAQKPKFVTATLKRTYAARANLRASIEKVLDEIAWLNVYLGTEPSGYMQYGLIPANTKKFALIVRMNSTNLNTWTACSTYFPDNGTVNNLLSVPWEAQVTFVVQGYPRAVPVRYAPGASLVDTNYADMPDCIEGN